MQNLRTLRPSQVNGLGWLNGVGCLIVSSWCAVAVGGCAAQPVEQGDPLIQVQTERMLIPVRVPLRLDLLVVIDNSPLMQGMQASLASHARSLGNVLNSMPGGLPDLHLAVISSDMGTGGGTSAAGCSARGDNGAFFTGGVLFTDGQAFLNDRQTWGMPSRRTKNYQGSLLDAMSNLFTLPASTCRYAQPLRAISRALFPLDGEPGSVGNQSGTGKAGFIRDDATLVVLNISANDDCSLAPTFLSESIANDQAIAFRCFASSIACDEAATTVGPHHNCRPRTLPGTLSAALLQKQLMQLKGGAPEAYRKIVISVLAGAVPDVTQVVVAPSSDLATSGLALANACTYSYGANNVVASPGLRLMDFATRFISSSATAICREDFSDALSLVASHFPESSNIFGPRCFDSRLVEPLDCAFTQYRNFSTPQQRQRLLPRCDNTSSNAPCVRITTDPAACPAPNAGVRVDYEPGRNQVYSGTVVSVECATTD